MDTERGRETTRSETRTRPQSAAGKREWHWNIGSTCFTILMVAFMIVTGIYAIVKMAVGIIYMDNCPLDIRIPIYVLVSGCTMFVFLGFYKLKPAKDKTKSLGFEDRASHYGTITGLVALVFFFIWLICGSVWTFSNYNDVKNDCGDSTDCCDINLMTFSYVITVLDWIFMFISIFTILVTCCLLYCSRKN